MNEEQYKQLITSLAKASLMLQKGGTFHDPIPEGQYQFACSPKTLEKITEYVKANNIDLQQDIKLAIDELRHDELTKDEK